MSENTINETFLKCKEAGFKLVEVKGKKPFIPGWQNLDVDVCPNKGNGIGLQTGEKSGVVCLDLDAECEEIKNEFRIVLKKANLKIISGKKGNPNRLGTLFFKYTPLVEKSEHHVHMFDILSNGCQTVLPPSMHDDGFTYKWINRPVWEVINDLPEITQELLEDLRGILKKYPKEKRKSTKPNAEPTSNGNCGHVLHLDISAYLMGLIATEQYSFDEIVNRIMKYDSEYSSISYFTCEDRFQTKRIKQNAQWFVNQAYKNHPEIKRLEVSDHHGKDFGIYKDPNEDFTPSAENIKEKYQKITPHLTGLAQDIFEHIYRNSPVPITQFSYSSTMLLLSTLFGNKCHIDGVYPNLYVFNIAPSASGKEAPQAAIEELLHASGLENLLASADITSPNTILLDLVDFPNRLFKVDEAHKIFSKANKLGNTIRDLLAELYSKGGKHYKGKRLPGHRAGKEPIGKMFSPQLNLMFSSTPTAIKAELNSEFIETGLGSRFLYFFEDREKVPNYKFKKSEVAEEIIKTIKTINRIYGQSEFTPEKNLEKNPAPELEIEDADMLPDIKKEFYEAAIKETDNRKKIILKRKIENFLKLVIITHCYKNPFDFTSKTVSKKTIEIAKAHIDAIYNNMLINLGDAISEHSEDAESTFILRYIEGVFRRSCSGVTMQKISNACRKIPRRNRKEAIQSLLEMGKIRKKDREFFPTT